MTVEVLYFGGCPSNEALLPRLRELVAEAGLQAGDIKLRCVDDLDVAERERFLGSPTVRVDGVDVDPAAAARADYGLKCRLYRSNGEVLGTPPDEWIRSALEGRT
jgi:hypothetical protein